MPRSRSLAATTYRTLSWNLATRSSPATISPTTRESSKARYRPRGDLVRCSSTSLACPPRQCLTPVLLAVPIVAIRKARLRLRKYPAARLHRRASNEKDADAQKSQAASLLGGNMASESESNLRLEIGHVLFIDLV